METLTFNAIDVETANADRASICQIGIVHVRDGVITDHWQSLIDPNAWFDPLNVSIHGINAQDVKNSPSFSDIRGELDRLSGSILISHTSFDRVSVERALKEHDLEPLRVTWLDSARIVRRAWPEQYGKSGWGLKNVATDLDIVFNHHDALEDARAAAEIVLRACTATDTEIADWLHLVNRSIFPPSDRASVFGPEANPDGSLYGETILFTGELSVPRREASKLAAQAGCNVADNVSKKVTAQDTPDVVLGEAQLFGKQRTRPGGVSPWAAAYPWPPLTSLAGRSPTTFQHHLQLRHMGIGQRLA